MFAPSPQKGGRQKATPSQSNNGCEGEIIRKRDEKWKFSEKPPLAPGKKPHFESNGKQVRRDV